MAVKQRKPKNPVHGLQADVYGNIGLDGRMDNPSRLNGVYRARVEYNQDENGQGRVQIRVPELHGLNTNGIPTSSLPWASLMCSSAGAGYGSYMVPEVGEYVMVQFENGDPYKPIVMGSVYGSGPLSPKNYGSGKGEDDEKWSSTPGEKEVPPENLRPSPSLKTLYKSPTGATISVDEKKGSENILIGDGLGQHIKINTNMNAGSTRKGPSANRGSDGTCIEMLDSGGQTITMTSSKGHNNISLRSQEGWEVKIDPSADGYHVYANNSTIHIDRSGHISIHGESDVHITSDDSIHLHSKNSSVDLEGSCTINAPDHVFIRSGSGTTINASGSINIGGDGVTIGAPVTLIDPRF